MLSEALVPFIRLQKKILILNVSNIFANVEFKRTAT
jgi:hypothetical protein